MTILIFVLLGLVLAAFVMISKIKDDIDDIEYLMAFKAETEDLLDQYKNSFDIISEGFELLKKYNAIQDERLTNLETQVGSTTQDEVNQYLSDILKQVQLKVQDLEFRLAHMTYEGPDQLTEPSETQPIPDPVPDSTNENVISDDAPKAKKKSRKKKVSE